MQSVPVFDRPVSHQEVCNHLTLESGDIVNRSNVNILSMVTNEISMKSALPWEISFQEDHLDCSIITNSCFQVLVNFAKIQVSSKLAKSVFYVSDSGMAMVD